ncbi:HAMP domain-containing sensor histidine kinase [Sideroxydans sp. CL21]|uniref:sensor histidine kinase n=1 Tax=Sideroxydans sp. CL21 TaxID=2600596 RepID=UPI0024BC1EEC|nr:HAMP domain-containing sensor histidine kinase [Sideroxydans sp. CL21]
MFQTNSLRFRVAFFYAIFGAGLSILLAAGAYLTVEHIGHQLMDEALLEELNKHASESIFIEPNTVSIKGYVISDTKRSPNIPYEVEALTPGKYNMTVGNIDYRVLVVDKYGARYIMMFDTQLQHFHEAVYFRYVETFALFMIFSSAAGGYWLASRVTSSVTRLARQVGQAEPGDTDLSLSWIKETSNDEVGELARAFDRYLRRLREFIERENFFTADVSHELRTPLAIMLGAVEVLEQDASLSPKQKERITRIHRATQDMIDLTSALLLMAREHLGAADEQPCDVSDVALACVEKHRHLVGERPIRLDVETIAKATLIVERPLLEIVIGNLIRNALFHTKSGSVLLKVEAEKLTVTDTGVGMRPEELERAMERYYKGASSAGAGVGLSLVKRICDRYGWRITLDSKEGVGTSAVIDYSAS